MESHSIKITDKVTDKTNGDDYKKFKKGTTSKISNLSKKVTNVEKKVTLLLEQRSTDYIDICKRIEKIEKVLYILSENNQEILKKLDHSIKPLKNIESLDSAESTEFKDIVAQSFKLDPKIILKCLSLTNLTGDVKIFKLLYMDSVKKEYYPIRYIGKKTYQYWLNNKWNEDLDGTYIKDTILRKNISRCYLKVNIIDQINDMDQFIKNQTHISKLSDSRYQDKWLSNIKQFISI